MGLFSGFKNTLKKSEAAVIDEGTRNALIISLGNILSELEVNGRLYPLNGIDEQLLSATMAIFAEATEATLDSPLGREIDDILGDS